jgi:hypothetical protein
METITVNALALRQLLVALSGPGHYIRELQATRGPLTSIRLQWRFNFGVTGI